MTDRARTLQRIKHLLSTDDGKLLLVELADQWDAHTLMGDTPQRTGHAVGLRDAYRYVIALANGELIHE
jgi:hypothetical protein